MAKAQGAALPLKSQKQSSTPKASAITAHKKPSQLSEELVVDSDSDSVPDSSKAQNVLRKESVRRESNTEALKAATSKKTKPPSPPVPSDPSSEDDEDDEEESSSSGSESEGKVQDVVATSSKTPVQPPQVNGVKRKAQEESSSESESDESSESSDDKEEKQGSKAKKARTSSSETSESSGDHESSSVEEDKASLKATQKDTNTSPLESSRNVKTKPFQPPAGYAPLDPQAFEIGPIVDQSDLEDAQIWHIAAPSSVPFASIAGMTLDSIEKGEPILKHNGINYILQSEPSNTGEAEFLMLPGKHDYNPSPIAISRRLHLQQQIVLPNLSRKQANPDTGAAAAADIARTAVSTIRPQPKGLRMRYKPAGFGPGRPGIVGSESDSDDDEAVQSIVHKTLQFPAAMGAHGIAGKEAAAVNDTSRIEQAAKKKHKKKKKERLVNGEATSKRPRSNSVDTPMVDTVSESKEDKAKRKDEERRRKEAKKARPSSKGSDAS